MGSWAAHRQLRRYRTGSGAHGGAHLHHRRRALRITALDLPGQILQALELGIISAAEASVLRDYAAKVMNIINVDDFAPHELGVGAGAM
ncbi:MAG: acyl-CoA dehydrogenase domain-containing protein [Steroidobacteraceae bacterium]